MRILILGAALTMAVGSAHAADATPAVTSEPAIANFYVSLHGGWVSPSSSDAIVPYDIDDPDQREAVTFYLGAGYRVGGAIGLDLTPNLSVEGEVSYGSAEMEHVSLAGSEKYDLIGEASTLSLMSNVIVGTDFGGWRPYVGIGAGAVLVAAHMPSQTVMLVESDDSAWTWGAQLIAGVEFDVTEELSVGARYRYQYHGDVELYDTLDRLDDLSGSATQSIEITAKLGF